VHDRKQLQVQLAIRDDEQKLIQEVIDPKSLRDKEVKV